MTSTTHPLAKARPRLRPLGFVAAAIAVAAGTYLAASLRASPSPGSPTVAQGENRGSISAPAATVAAGGTEQLLAAIDHEIDLWSTSLDANEGNFIAAGSLGSAYLQRARLTGDLGDYGRALDAADRAVTADPIYWSGHALRASVLLATHDFRPALEEARTTFAADPTQLDALAVIGDASLELGDVAAAEAAYRQLSEAADVAPVRSRLGHLSFIRGDAERARELVIQAIAATPAADDPLAAAFYHYQLGELQRAAGDVAGADAAYADALAISPEYVPAMAGLARIREEQGRRAEAIELLEAASLRLPQPELVAALGDLYALDGDLAAAERQYALVEGIGQAGRATGSVYDRQLVLFAADHDRGVATAVDDARAELAVRGDIYGHDALAWALYTAGELDEAAAEAAAAMALGTPDPRLAYHAGMIAAAQGRTDDARQLLGQALDAAAYLPAAHVPVAEEAYARLSGGT